MNTYETDNLSRLRNGLAECTVLLKKDGRFPLASPCKIAAYGAGVRHTVKGGTGSGEVNSRFFVTVEQGLADAGFEITTKNWLDAYDLVQVQAHKQFVQDIKARAKKNHTSAIIEGMGAVMAEPDYDLPLDAKADACIYVLSRISGEGNDRQVTAGDFLLSATEKRDILDLNNKFENFMLVLNVGAPVDLSPVLEVKNILVLSQLGVETGAALADILLGKAYPSGKLTTTWDKPENYPDVGNFGDINDTFYKEGIYVGYRWFDATKKKAAFPFGFGLGYTDFSMAVDDITVEKTVATVTVTVANTGAFRGKETVQVYLSCPQGKLDKPVKDLAAFAKTRELGPGETDTVTAAFDLKDCASFDEETAAWILEAGNYVVHVGASSADTKAAACLTLDKTVAIRLVKNLLGDPGFMDWKPEVPSASLELPVIQLNAADFTTEVVNYTTAAEIDPEINALTPEQLGLMNMGAFDPKGGMANVIGSASFAVAGAAGESYSGIPNIHGIVMADGPAGLRLSKRYYTDKKGVHSFGVTMPETVLEFMPKIAQWFMCRPPKLPKGATLREQYCTAIPIGTALAQSWNPAFAKTCGDVVGSEMERFGVHLWLAPAINIHRTPLCGRNFEYFSEDPLISGIFAAAITNGVQSHPGCGTTVKHYCANNQETNRYYSNSHVSQRAMREIYLKAFGICVKQSQPKAVMTSYNLLNGVHTSESYELNTDILRSEFGFRGIVMTDWVVASMPAANGSIYKVPDPAKVAASGNDLYMPGSKEDQERLIAGCAEGRVSEKQLKINATRISRMAKILTSDLR